MSLFTFKSKIKAFNNKRIDALDSLRGIAALMVVINHLLFFRKGFAEIQVFGYFGVALFFLISGFVISLTVKPNTTVREFLINRFSRLYPAYWASIVIITGIHFIMLKGHLGNFSNTVINITMLQNWMGTEDLDGTYWTLHVEMTFYFLATAIIVFNQIKNILLIFFTILFLLATCSIFQLINIYPKITNLFVFIFPLTNYFSYFLAGVCFCSVYKNGSNYLMHLLICICFLLSIITIPLFQNVKLNIIPFNLYAIVCAVIFLIFYLLIIHKLSFLNLSAFRFFGKISYSLYITHFYISFCFIVPVLESKGVNWIVVRFITIAIIFPLAYIVNRFVEVPAMAIIRNKFLKKSI